MWPIPNSPMMVGIGSSQGTASVRPSFRCGWFKRMASLTQACCGHSGEVLRLQQCLSGTVKSTWMLKSKVACSSGSTAGHLLIGNLVVRSPRARQSLHAKYRWSRHSDGCIRVWNRGWKKLVWMRQNCFESSEQKSVIQEEPFTL